MFDYVLNAPLHKRFTTISKQLFVNLNGINFVFYQEWTLKNRYRRNKLYEQRTTMTLTLYNHNFANIFIKYYQRLNTSNSTWKFTSSLLFTFSFLLHIVLTCMYVENFELNRIIRIKSVNFLVCTRILVTASITLKRCKQQNGNQLYQRWSSMIGCDRLCSKFKNT